MSRPLRLRLRSASLFVALTTAIATVAVLGAPGTAFAKAEGLIQATFGRGWTQDLGENDFRGSLSGGFMTIRFFEDNPSLGIGAAFHGFSPDPDFDTLSLGVPFVLKTQLFETDDRKKGWLRPYVSVAPTLFLSAYQEHDTEQELDIGFASRVGVHLLVRRSLALVVEYRNSSFRLKNQGIRSWIVTHHSMTGLAYWF